MATGFGRARIAPSTTLPILAVLGLGIGCSGVTTPERPPLAVTTGDVNSCPTPATGPPAAGAGHTILGAAPVPRDGTPFAVAISPTGVTYVTQLLAATASRADLPSTTFSQPFPVGNIPSQVRMSPDGKTAYVGDQDSHTITYVNVATNQAFATATVPAGSILTVGLTPDGKWLYALTDFHGVYIINATSREVEDSIPVSSTGTILAGVAFHPFSPCVYVASRDQGQVTTVNTRSKQVVQTFVVSGANIQNVAVSPDGATLFATDIHNSKLLAWDLTSGSAQPLQYPVGTPVSRNAFDVAVTPDNTQVYVSALADGAVFVFDRTTRAPITTIGTGGSPRYVGFTATGNRAVIPNEAGWVSFSNVPDICGAPAAGPPPAGGTHPTRTSDQATPLGGTPFAVAISPRGVTYVTQLLAASASRADLPSTSFSTSFAVGDIPSQVRMSPDGRTAYVGDQDARTITYVDVATNQAVATTSVPAGSILTIGLSPDGKRLYALTDFYGVYVISTDTRTVIDSIKGAGTILAGVAFHPAAPCMYVASRDEGRVSTVNLRTNTVVRSQTLGGARIQNLAVSRDGAVLFATDIARSKLLARDLRSDGSAFSEFALGTPESRNAFDVAVTADNKQVYVSTLADGKLYVFDLGSRTIVDSVMTGGSPRYIGFDAGGTTAVIPNEAGWGNFLRCGQGRGSLIGCPVTG